MALFENPDQLRQLQELLYPNRNRRGGNADSSTDSEDEGQSLVVTKAQGKRDRHLLQLSLLLSHTHGLSGSICSCSRRRRSWQCRGSSRHGRSQKES